MRRAAPSPLNSPHPNPLPVRRGEGEATAHSLRLLNSTTMIPGRGDLTATAQAAGVKDVAPAGTAVGESPVICGFRLWMAKSLPAVMEAAHFN